MKLLFIEGSVPSYFNPVTIAQIASVINNNSHVIEKLNDEIEELKKEVENLKKAREEV